MIKNLQKKLTLARYVTWSSFILFILSLFGGSYLSGTPVSLLVFISLPLIFLLPGMLRENYKSLSMLSFVTLLYFIPLVVNVMSPDYDASDVASLVLICILFTASMMFSRWKQYDVKLFASA